MVQRRGSRLSGTRGRRSRWLPLGVVTIGASLALLVPSNGFSAGHGVVLASADASGMDVGVVPPDVAFGFKEGAEVHRFESETNRLLDILIHSLYSNKDVFLRELISNASDALDKLRFLSLTNPKELGTGDVAELDVRISVDEEARTMTIQDKGVGMTKEELAKNLGTIAKSGTSAFLEQMEKGADTSLIGQFGVGFYSAFLVSDWVEVASKSNKEDKQWLWESNANGEYSVREDTEGEPLGRGTRITLHLKEDAATYLKDEKVTQLIKRYSQFINFPIYYQTTTMVDREVPVEDGDEDASPSDEPLSEDEDEVSDAEDDEGKPKTKFIKVQETEWEKMNDVKAIWLRSPSEVEQHEYDEFFKNLNKGNGNNPLMQSHFSAEGDVEFRSILFIPNEPAPDMYDNAPGGVSRATLKLYVRRVFISDDFEELLPKYLSFVKGVVDSDTLPLNVNRETLQQSNALKTIKKKVIRKILDMIRKASEEYENGEDAGETKIDDEGTPIKLKSKWENFWEHYSKNIKLGVIEDSTNRNRLAKLLRFTSSSSPDKGITLQTYVDRMKEGQDNIYFIAAENAEAARKSPFAEKLFKRGYEVLYFLDAMDEYIVQHLTEFDDKKFINVSKDDLKFGEADEAQEKATLKRLKKVYKPLTSWYKDLMSSEVEKVVVSNRLDDTPMVVVSGKYGWSAHMERMMKAQAMHDDRQSEFLRPKKTLELNPRHPLVKELLSRVELTPEDESLRATARTLYEMALLASGFDMDDHTSLSSRVYSMVSANLGIPEDAVVDEEIFDEPTDEADEEVAMGDGDFQSFNMDDFDMDSLRDSMGDDMPQHDEL